MGQAMAAPGLRSDAPLIRYLSKAYGPGIGRAWQDLPLLQIPDETHDGIMQLGRESDALVLDYLPFPDFMLDFGSMIQTPQGETTVWCRVSEGRAFGRTQHLLCPFWSNKAVFAGLGSQHVVCTIWTQRPARGFDALPVLAAVDRGAADLATQLLFDGTGKDHLYDAQTGTLRQEALADVAPLIWYALRTVHYLGVCPDYVVEERPERFATRPSAHKDKKPWAFCYLPRLILLDPHKGPAGGATPRTSGGAHASPRPHQRRAHWRTLRHPRFAQQGARVRVKAAWVGPRTWMSQGNVYRVIEHKDR